MECIISDSKIVPDEAHSKKFKLNLSHTNLKELPNISAPDAIIKLKNTPLSLRARYEARHDCVSRHTFLAVGISALMVHGLKIGIQALLQKLQNDIDEGISFIPNPAEFFSLLLAASGMGLVVIQPSKKIFGPQFKITEKQQSKLERVQEYVEDTLVITFDLFSYLFRLPKRTV